ncbi:hypothetical protein MKX01_019788 [Papaver californicum]|nr:hypothetical protein MKX01_019788 [Papaver californicum]
MDIVNLQTFQPPSKIHVNDFDDQLDEFINHMNLEEFVEPIDPYYYHDNFQQQQLVDNELMYFSDDGASRYNNNNQLFSTPGDLFELMDYYSAAAATATAGSTTTTTSDPVSVNSSVVPSFDSITDIDALEEEDEGYKYSSATTSKRPSSSSVRNSFVDYSTNLSAERKRRVQMKQNLYALRTLVPNITKMDKASIIWDAVSYVQDLQKEAKRLKTEIAALEPTLTNKIEKCNNLVEIPKEHQICKKIVKMDVFQVEENEFYVRIACNKGDGVAACLYKFIESLTSFHVQSSNFATFPHKLDFTFTLHAKECGAKMMNLSNLKLWLNEALLNQGFL